jgi:hypothetical protein
VISGDTTCPSKDLNSTLIDKLIEFSMSDRA